MIWQFLIVVAIAVSLIKLEGKYLLRDFIKFIITRQTKMTCGIRSDVLWDRLATKKVGGYRTMSNNSF